MIYNNFSSVGKIVFKRSFAYVTSSMLLLSNMSNFLYAGQQQNLEENIFGVVKNENQERVDGKSFVLKDYSDINRSYVKSFVGEYDENEFAKGETIDVDISEQGIGKIYGFLLGEGDIANKINFVGIESQEDLLNKIESLQFAQNLTDYHKLFENDNYLSVKINFVGGYEVELIDLISTNELNKLFLSSINMELGRYGSPISKTSNVVPGFIKLIGNNIDYLGDNYEIENSVLLGKNFEEQTGKYGILDKGYSDIKLNNSEFVVKSLDDTKIGERAWADHKDLFVNIENFENKNFGAGQDVLVNYDKLTNGSIYGINIGDGIDANNIVFDGGLFDGFDNLKKFNNLIANIESLQFARNLTDYHNVFQSRDFVSVKINFENNKSLELIDLIAGNERVMSAGTNFDYYLSNTAGVDVGNGVYGEGVDVNQVDKFFEMIKENIIFGTNADFELNKNVVLGEVFGNKYSISKEKFLTKNLNKNNNLYLAGDGDLVLGTVVDIHKLNVVENDFIDGKGFEQNFALNSGAGKNQIQLVGQESKNFEVTKNSNQDNVDGNSFVIKNYSDTQGTYSDLFIGFDESDWDDFDGKEIFVDIDGTGIGEIYGFTLGASNTINFSGMQDLTDLVDKIDSLQFFKNKTDYHKIFLDNDFYSLRINFDNGYTLDFVDFMGSMSIDELLNLQIEKLSGELQYLTTEKDDIDNLIGMFQGNIENNKIGLLENNQIDLSGDGQVVLGVVADYVEVIEPEEYEVIFDVEPTDLDLEVKNLSGDIQLGTGNIYKLENGEYNYTASATGYNSLTGGFEVSGTGLNINIELEEEVIEPEEYEVIFDVEPTDLDLEVRNLSGDLQVGTGNIYNLENGEYNYIASATGYNSLTGGFEVSGTGKTINISLEEVEPEEYEVIFDVEPTDLDLEVENLSGDIQLGTGNIYNLENGNYTYIASATGYNSLTGGFEVSGTGLNINIELEEEVIEPEEYEVIFDV
ncbi:hypothetical protein, partial [Candidatus Vampirococcus lugosii]|nr:hypothetical protein [Candidatus Vampirococcus lugosii]